MSEQHYDGVDRRSPTELGWHLKKEVNLSIIISMIGIAVAMVTAYTDLKKDIELIKADTAVLHQRDDKQNQDLEKAISTLQSHYTRMDAKLDRLIERTVR